MNINDAVNSVMKWAQESNDLCCTPTVLPPAGPDALQGQSLDGAYYGKAAPMLDKQIAKGTPLPPPFSPRLLPLLHDMRGERACYVVWSLDANGEGWGW